MTCKYSPVGIATGTSLWSRIFIIWQWRWWWGDFKITVFVFIVTKWALFLFWKANIGLRRFLLRRCCRLHFRFLFLCRANYWRNIAQGCSRIIGTSWFYGWRNIANSNTCVDGTSIGPTVQICTNFSLFGFLFWNTYPLWLWWFDL